MSPLEHLPYGVFSLPGEPARVGVALDEHVLDLAQLAATGQLDFDPALFAERLNPFMAAGREVWHAVRSQVIELLTTEARGVEHAFHLRTDVELHLPFAVADYVDFYSSRAHAENLGRLFRPDAEPLTPNWLSLPIGYHGRAGTVVVSGTPIRRPRGQVKPPGADSPAFQPSSRLDIELELGVVIGTPSRPGEPVPVQRALEHVFGVVLVNDWSARDIQAWEYVPLGPFLGKSFATSIGAWVTPLEALAPYRVPGATQDPEPLAHLRVSEPTVFDVELEVELNGDVISHTNARNLYWTVEQQIAHLTSNGAVLRAGDLLASGTISGAEPGSRGSLIELTWNGAEPLQLEGGGTRTFLEDGDEVVLRGRTSGFELAEVRGRIEPS